MKYKKILVIFLFALFSSYFIYIYNCDKKLNILFLGDNTFIKKEFDTFDDLLFESINNRYNINAFNTDFIYDKKSYYDIINDIENNIYIYSKDKNVYLNQLIGNSDYIIISANNDEYFNKCKKDKYILDNYNVILTNKINKLVSLINKISNAKIIVIGNYCNNSEMLLNIKSDRYKYIINDKLSVYKLFYSVNNEIN